MDFTSLLLICISSLQIVHATFRVDVYPREIALLKGETLNAACRVEKSITGCRWTVDGRDPRIEWAINFNHEQCNITVKNAPRKLNGVLACHLATNAQSKRESIGNITVLILIAPEIIVAKINHPYDSYEPDNFKEGDLIRADCMILDKRPIAIISWFIGTERIDDGIYSSQHENKSDSQKIYGQRVLRYLKYFDNGKDLVCLAGPQYTRSSGYKLNVIFPPKLKVEQFLRLTVGQSGSIVVSFHANPLPEIQWLVDGTEIREGDTDATGRYHADFLVKGEQGAWKAVLHINEVKSEDVKKNYTLIAKNQLGQGEYTVVVPACVAPCTDITVWSIAGIVAIAFFIDTVISILLFYEATGEYPFAEQIARIKTRFLRAASGVIKKKEEEEVTTDL